MHKYTAPSPYQQNNHQQKHPWRSRPALMEVRVEGMGRPLRPCILHTITERTTRAKSGIELMLKFVHQSMPTIYNLFALAHTMRRTRSHETYMLCILRNGLCRTQSLRIGQCSVRCRTLTMSVLSFCKLTYKAIW